MPFRALWTRPVPQYDPPPLEQSSLLADFLKQDAFAALLLLGAALLALVLANTGLSTWYHHFWALELSFSLAGHTFSASLHHWVNDALMSVFFFLVGLEIKRELLVGELASVRMATLPAAAALGGMLAPALIFTAFNYGHVSVRGWGIPMATDIAFAMGCLALLGKRVPANLGVFLVALAIVDDLGSVVVIAVFYSGGISLAPLVVGTGLIIISFCIGKLGVRHAAPYILLGVIVWFAFLSSGVHSTIAGVLLAFTIPADARYETPHFFGRMKTLLDRFTHAEDHVNPLLVNQRQQSLIRSMLLECHHVEAPLQRIEHNLHPFAVFVIMPIFAFANSGVTLPFDQLSSMVFQPVTLGVLFGLIFGKQLGIMFFSWATVRLGWAELPKGIGWAQVYGLTWLAGIGFTMSLFISELAFARHPAPGPVPGTESLYLAEGKLGVFIASIVAGTVGCLILTRLGGNTTPDADEVKA